MAQNWIHNRCCSTGTSLNPNPSAQRKGPLRKIVGQVYPDDAPGLFHRVLVELECGHQVVSDGQFRARCQKCRQRKEAEETQADAAQHSPEFANLQDAADWVRDNA